MRVNRVSLVFHLALNAAGIAAQTAPMSMDARPIMISSGAEGHLLPKLIAKNAAAIAPIVICPSAPMFQNFIRKHGARASAVPSSGAATLTT